MISLLPLGELVAEVLFDIPDFSFGENRIWAISENMQCKYVCT